MRNPFIYVRSLAPGEFSGRQTELNRIFDCLATSQSVAIVGELHTGKTSMLNFIENAESRRGLFGDEGEKGFFVYFDSQARHHIHLQSDFWKLVLWPLRDSEYSAQYERADQESYSNFVLEEVFRQLGHDGRKFVLLLDEFDTILKHPVLHNPDFYGGLRTLASRFSEGFMLIIAVRHPLDHLNQLTWELNPRGSPYFNIFIKIQLGQLKPEVTTALLDLGGDHITDTDRLYIERVSGRHPYLTQAAAMLWKAHEDGFSGQERYSKAGHSLYDQTSLHFTETWRSWSNTTRRAVTAAALAQIPRLLADHKFKVSELVKNFDDYTPELNYLGESGTLSQNDDGEWIVAQDALLWWIADEIRRAVRDETPFENWIRAQHMDNLLTEQDKQNLNQAAKKLLEVAVKGATTLIEALAKEFGTAMVK